MWFALSSVACREPDAPQVRLEVPGAAVAPVSRPIVGGAAAASPRWVVAADTDGDRLVALTAGDRRPREIRFPLGWAPAVVALDGDRAAVTLPGAGAIAVVGLDPLSAEVVPVCAEPRGVDLDGARWAAVCADGQLVLSDGARLPLERDARDVMLDDDRAWVSFGRAATVAVVDLADGAVVDRWTLPTLPDPDGRPLVARVARRMVPVDGGGVAVLHQAHVADEIALELVGAAPYGSGACDAVARPLVTWVGVDGPERTVRIDAVLPVDLALWPEGDGAFVEPTPVVGGAAAATGDPAVDAAWRGAMTSAYPPSGLADPARYCLARAELAVTPGIVTGVAVGPDGPLAVTRAPFAIEAVRGPWLAADPEAPIDAGLALFHRAAPSGVACATCHVDGRDDAHTWQFAGFGPRRTQSLAGGLTASAPFHWDGVLPDLTALVLDTGVFRMGLAPVSPAEIVALGVWLDGLPPAPPSASAAEPVGERLFADGCATCHDPPRALGADVGTGGVFQAPALHGLEARLPLMHDGCADTLLARFDPACGGDRHGPALDDAEIAALVAYLRTR